MLSNILIFISLHIFFTITNSEHVLVTGGLGFIGSHVVEELINRNYKVTILDNESNGNNRVSDLPNIVIGDISTPELYEQDLLQSILPVDYVIHLAAAISVTESMSDPKKYEKVNINGSEMLFKWALKNGVKRIVTASSAAIYGNSAPLPIEESSGYGGISPYAESKWLMEKLQENLWNSDSLDSVALRFFNVFGPRQDPSSPYTGVISKFMYFASKKEDLTIFGDGEQTRDFIYVKDVANAIIHTMKNKEIKKFDSFNVCNGKQTTINELASLIIQIFSENSNENSNENENENKKSNIIYGPARDGDIRDSVCNISHLFNDLKFSPNYNIIDGLRYTRDWFLEQQKQKQNNLKIQKIEL